MVIDSDKRDAVDQKFETFKLVVIRRVVIVIGRWGLGQGHDTKGRTGSESRGRDQELGHCLEFDS